MAKTVTTPWDPADHLKSEEDMAAYLEAALEEGDPALVAAALGDIARAKGMTQVARDRRSRAREPLQGTLAGWQSGVRNDPQGRVSPWASTSRLAGHRKECGLTLRSKGRAPASRLARATATLIIHCAGQSPSRACAPQLKR